MSIAKDFSEGEKLVLSASVFWQEVEAKYAGDGATRESRRRWRRLAMMHLYTHCQWTCEMIGAAFSLHRCNVSRAITTCRRDLQLIFQFAPNERDPEGLFDAENTQADD